MENNNLLEQFGSHIFTDDVMRESELIQRINSDPPP